MLLKMLEHMGKVDNLSLTHKAIVKANNDPKKLGRVKCEIVGLIQGAVADLPWVYPFNPTGLGGKVNVGWFAVPEVGSELVVGFPFNDIYFPVYYGYWQSASTHQPLFDSNYPNSYGWRDSKGNHIKVDKQDDYIEVKHGSSGATVKVDGQGNITVTTPKKFKVDADEVEILSAKGVKITATGDVDVLGSSINLNE